MSVVRKLGVLVFFGVPVIIGGGIVFELFNHTWPPVVVFEMILLGVAGAYLAR